MEFIKMARLNINHLPSISTIVKTSGALEILGDDFEGRVALLGFLKEFSEGNIGDPEDYNLWMHTGKSILEQKTNKA